MTTYVYERDGERVERSYPIGTAPASVRVGRRVFKRALIAPRMFLQPRDRVLGRDIDFLADGLDVGLHGKHHKGRIVVDQHGERRLHFGSRDEIEHLKRSWNDSADSEKHGKLRYGECDEWADDVRRGSVAESERAAPVKRRRRRA